MAGIVKMSFLEKQNSRSAMSLEKVTSYRDLPYSTETPEDEFHSYLSVRQLVAKLRHHQHHMFKFRSVGKIRFHLAWFLFQELDDAEVEIRVRFDFMKLKPPRVPVDKNTSTRSCAVQIYGQAISEKGQEPLLFVNLIYAMFPSLAMHLRDTMAWVVAHHAVKRDVDHQEGRKKLKAVRRSQNCCHGVACAIIPLNQLMEEE